MNMYKIKFEIKKPGPVAIKIVNILGSQFSAMVNLYEIPGKYEIDFNCDNLMPGSYYFKIYDIEGIEHIPVESLNGNHKLIESGSLKVGSSLNEF